MEIFTKDRLSMEFLKAEELFIMSMEINILGNSRMENDKGEAFSTARMEINMMGNGEIIKNQD